MRTDALKIYAGVLAAAVCLGSTVQARAFWTEGGESGGALEQLGLAAGADDNDVPVPAPAVIESGSAGYIGDVQEVKENFEKLERLYGSGRIPTMKEFTGMKMGREFPDYGNPFEAVFMGMPEPGDSPAGPVDGDSGYYRPAFTVQRGACDMRSRKGMEKALAQDSPAPTVWRTNGELGVGFRDNGVTYSFRMAGDYLLMKKTRGIDNSYSISYFYKDCPEPELAERIKGEIEHLCDGLNCAIKDVKEGLAAAKAEREAAKARQDYEDYLMQRGHMQ